MTHTRSLYGEQITLCEFMTPAYRINELVIKRSCDHVKAAFIVKILVILKINFGMLASSQYDLTSPE